MATMRRLGISVAAALLLGTVVVTGAASQVAGPGEPAYVDDRSTPEQVLRSYTSAINRREYARAYSYWESGAADLAPYPEFEQGFADTASVELNVVGPVGSGVGAGQLYWGVPVELVAQSTGGETRRFAGCYVLHLARPQLQAVPPFRPIGIRSAAIRAGEDAKAECPPV
jgi:hypothetical protein